MVFWEERANIARSFSPSEGVAILIYACVSFIVHSFLLVRFFRSRYLGFLRRFINSPAYLSSSHFEFPTRRNLPSRPSRVAFSRRRAATSRLISSGRSRQASC